MKASRGTTTSSPRSVSKFRVVERVERALRGANMTIDQLASGLFLGRDSVRFACDQLMREGKIHRDLVGQLNPKPGRREYIYSLLAPSTQEARADVARELVGTWDAL